jgi:hypothetical protein
MSLRGEELGKAMNAAGAGTSTTAVSGVLGPASVGRASANTSNSGGTMPASTSTSPNMADRLSAVWRSHLPRRSPVQAGMFW